MEENTYNEKFNELWNTSKLHEHNVYILRKQVGISLLNAEKNNNLVYIGESHPYEPHKYIPVSYDGINEYIIINGLKILIYNEEQENKNENRIIVWPAIATTWILNGTDSQREFIEQNWELIFN